MKSLYSKKQYSKLDAVGEKREKNRRRERAAEGDYKGGHQLWSRRAGRNSREGTPNLLSVLVFLSIMHDLI
jgi:hypothetical protein